MMKILLVVKSKVMENLGVMYLSAVAKQAGHECKITDINDAPLVATAWHPEIIGYSIMTGDRERFNDLAFGIKCSIPHTAIVGGQDPTFFPEGYEWADHIFPGEAEATFSGFLGGSYDKHPNIDSIPWPDRTDFPNMKIRDFISSRGCPFDCGYCYNSKWAKITGEKKVRTRNARDVVEEINRVSPEFVYFQDSCFGVNMKWLREFSALYRREVNISYHCHLRPSQVDEERTLLLHDSNCYSVRIALETASDRLRKLINRGKTTNHETVKAAKLLRKWGIRLMIQNMIGIATSTIEEDLETLEVNIRCKPDYGWCSIYQPYPGTALGDLCKKEGLYTGDYSEISDSFFDKSVLNFTDEHKEQVECLQRIFALCVEVGYLPDVNELTYENFPRLIHKIMRAQGDRRLYGGIL